MKFNSNGKFTILQIADPQDYHRPRKAMLQMLDAAYDKVVPDLIVYTGDNVLGKIACEKELPLRRAALESALEQLISPVCKKDIPFAMVFGNHDDQCGVTKKEQVEIYRRYKGCLGFNDNNAELDYGTYNLPIMSSDGKRIAYNLWCIDSGGRDKNGKYYEYVSAETIEWYKKTSLQLCKENNGVPVNSLMFQHIPVPETSELLSEVSKGTPLSVEKDGKYYILNPQKASGTLEEYPCVCKQNFGQLDAVAQVGDVRAIVTGHDHINNFTGQVNGVTLIQTIGASFCSYGNRQRGVRVFVLDENDTSVFETYNLSFFELLGNNIKTRLQYFLTADR